MESKSCSHCNTEHLLIPEFWFKCGKYYKCKVYMKDYSTKNATKISTKSKRRREANRDKLAASRKVYYQANKTALNSRHRDYVKANKDKVFEWQKQYREDNKESLREYMKLYQRKRRASDPTAKLIDNIRKRVSRATRGLVKSFSHSTSKSLGCSLEELKSHIEDQFQEGMSWDNYGEWELDHIMPLANYDLNDRKTLNILCHYTNLQPLFKVDNIRKSNNEHLN